MASALDYVSAEAQPPRRRLRWRAWGLIALVLLVAMAAPVVTVRREESHMDAVTGSLRSRTVWILRFASGPQVDISPLEERLKRSRIAWSPSWQSMHSTHRNIFGGATCRECGTAPPIMQLRMVMKEFAAASTDAELREFVRVMEEGSETQREAAVEAACEKGLRARG